jgi:CRISPR-associated protein Cmr2
VWIHPFEIITIGGDDVWLIVPGDKALPIAAAISTAFSQKVPFPDEQEKPCTMSGGVVIADDHNPVRVLHDLAKRLTRQAKRARHKAEANIGYIDFHVFKSADMLDRKISTLRRQYPYTLSGLGEHGKDLRLMARPYPADVLQKLWGKLGMLRGSTPPFPTSQMHQLAESLLLGRHQSTLFYEYQRARDDKDHFVRLDAALEVAQRIKVKYPTPWEEPEDDDRYSHQTALWDIAEMYEFVP